MARVRHWSPVCEAGVAVGHDGDGGGAVGDGGAEVPELMRRAKHASGALAGQRGRRDAG